MATNPLTVIKTSFLRLTAISDDLNTRHNVDTYLALHNELKSIKERVIAISKTFSGPKLNQYVEGCNNSYNAIWSGLKNIVLPVVIGNTMAKIHQFVVKSTPLSGERIAQATQYIETTRSLTQIYRDFDLNNPTQSAYLQVLETRLNTIAGLSSPASSTSVSS